MKPPKLLWEKIADETENSLKTYRASCNGFEIATIEFEEGAWQIMERIEFIATGKFEEWKKLPEIKKVIQQRFEVFYNHFAPIFGVHSNKEHHA